MLTCTISALVQNIMLPHEDCPDEGRYQVGGGFDILLNHYQFDDLQTNGYTLATEYCLLCDQGQSWLISFVEHPQLEG
jgi:hypothetical protein